MRVASLSILILGVVATALLGLPATAEEASQPPAGAVAKVQAATEAPVTSVDKIPQGYVSVACHLRTATPEEPISVEPVEPVSYPPVPTSDPNCICPGGGPGYVMTGDTCQVSNDGRICTGVCVWWRVGSIAGFKFTECGTP